ncbi:putative ribonuclease H-like domain-containing protein [Tanacetum coccineum]
MFLLISQKLSAITVTEKGNLLGIVDLEGIKGEDLMVTMAGAMHQQMNLHHRHCEEESTPANDRFSKADGYHVVPPPITGNFLTPRADISFAGLDEYAIRKKITESKTTDRNTKTSETVGKTNETNTQKPKTVYESVNRDKVIIEDWNSDDEDNVSEVQIVSPVKTNEAQTVKTRVDKIGQTSQKQGIGFKKIKVCFVCKSTDHLIKDCTFHDRQSQEPKLKTVVNTGPRVDKPVWDNTKRWVHSASRRPNPEICYKDHQLWDSERNREFSVARTPQQNGVAERKNRTLIEAARTTLADSLLPIPFWAEAVNTACYVLNRVLVTKPQNKTPYELLLGKSPSISFMRPFGCPLTILNTLDPLGKFDGKAYEGYFLGYSTSSKAFRVYNKRTKRVEENMHIDFLEDQPNVTGIGPDWMFDLDFLTNSMNYIPISVENQVNVEVGTQGSYVTGSSGKDKEPIQEYILHPIHPYGTRILVEDVVQAAQEKPSKNAPKDNEVHDSEEVAKKEEQHKLTEAEQALKDDLEKLVTQEMVAKAMDDATRQAFEEEKKKIASTKRAAQATSINKLNTGRPSVSTANTPYVSAASTPTGANAGESSFVYLGGQIPIDASTLPNADLPTDPNMPDLEDDSDVFPNEGIFNGAYDDEDKGAEADFNNMDNTIDVSPIPTLRIHKDHPKGQILGDPKSAVQTRGKIQKASSAQQALVWILVDLPFGKKEIGTKWVFRNKRDERSIVVQNNARLVAQGFRHEEGIDYDEVFAPVARIEAIRLFLAFASFMGFHVCQMDVKSAFLYETIEEEVYVHQPPGFVDPTHPNKFYKVIKALYDLH